MGVRVDQLLHWLCLAGSRSFAARACAEGRVRVNGQRVKPAKEIEIGDRLLVNAPGGRVREVEIVQLPARQLSRREAPEYYRACGDPGGGSGDDPDMAAGGGTGDGNAGGEGRR